MKILMVTNTYLPHVGGVARSVDALSRAYRARGHEVVVVAPTFPDAPEHEEGVIRIPAVQQFNGSDFSVPVPIPGYLTVSLEGFTPQIVHAHHPFLLGDTALRIAALRNLPVVFTHHTRYDQYTRYVPGDSETMQWFAVDLATGFCNLCDAVFAPSESIADFLAAEGVTTPIRIVPTGVEREAFVGGNGREFRRQRGIPEDAVVVGHVGRLAPEKNLEFLAKAVAQFLKQAPRARFLVVGSGPSEQPLRAELAAAGVDARLVMTGTLTGAELAAAYAAMDVFAFASHSETQGMVLAEAMTAGVPVVAVDASGVRDIVHDGVNGRLLAADDVRAFAAALQWLVELTSGERRRMSAALQATAEEFSLDRCAERALAVYETLVARQARRAAPDDESLWATARRALEREWSIWANRAGALGSALAASATGEGAARMSPEVVPPEGPPTN